MQIIKVPTVSHLLQQFPYRTRSRSVQLPSVSRLPSPVHICSTNKYPVYFHPEFPDPNNVKANHPARPVVRSTCSCPDKS